MSWIPHAPPKSRPLRWLALWAVLLLPLAAAEALRCANRLVSVGDHASEVLRRCGAPDYVDERVAYRRYRRYESPLQDYYRYGGVESGKIYGPRIVEEPVVIEEWTYNFGPSRFMQLLRFENGRLKKIESLGYGY